MLSQLQINLRNKIGDFLTPEVIAVSPNDSVATAISLMKAKAISCLPVLESGRPVGIFTERNLTRHLVVNGFNFSDKPIAQVMTSPVLTVRPETPLYESYGLLVANKIRHLVVIDENGMAIGVVTLSNIISFLGSEYFVDVKLISQIMTKSIATVPPAATVRDALSHMVERAISCLIVTEDHLPLGILTERDATRLIGMGEEVLESPVSGVMSSPVHTVPLDTPVFEAATLMRKHRIRRLVVLNGSGKIAGLTTQSDIIRGLEGKYIDSLRQIVREKDSALRDTMRDLYEKSTYIDNILRSAVDFGIVATDLNLKIVYYNPAAEAIFGYRSADVAGKDLRDFHFRENVDLARFNRGIDIVSKRAHHTFTFEKTIDGEPRVLRARVSGIWNPDGRLVGYVLMLSDITERQRAEETIQYMAYHDTLTGLPNRQMFNDRLIRDLARCKRTGAGVAVFVLDLDRFKEVNDTYGHHAGDVVLKTIALRLGKTIREIDTVSRMGGDEFLMIIAQLDDEVEHALRVAERVAASIEEPIEIEGRTITITTSVGIAFYPRNGQEPDALIKAADRAMYEAKERHRSSRRSSVRVAEG
jgi:diguanylate cyclase (GGDEF)-like protein/PAS domain S-box-containing protein